MIELSAIKETTEDYEAVEKAIRLLFVKELYMPILRELGLRRDSVLRNAKMPGLSDALLSGRVTFYCGTFSGKFNSEISKALRALGAKFDRLTGTYKLPLSEMPIEVRQTISASEARFQQKLDKLDRKLGEVYNQEILHKGISEKLKTDHFFDRALWRVDKDFHAQVKAITITPMLKPEQRKRIADEWGTNMQLWVSDFAKKEITELRQNIMRTAFAGDRYGGLVKTIEQSYGVTERKAKFLARQETSLLMTKFKQTRYQSAGVEYYKWGCVAGSKNHPVRPWHRALEGKVFRWDDPPITTQPGTAVKHNNPGQDYNCRCFAKPLVGYKGKTSVKTDR